MKKLLALTLAATLMAATALAAPLFPFGKSPHDLVQATDLSPLWQGDCAGVGVTLLALDSPDHQGVLVVSEDGVAVLGIGQPGDLGAWALKVPGNPNDPWLGQIHFDDAQFKGASLCAILDHARGLLKGTLKPTGLKRVRSV